VVYRWDGGGLTENTEGDKEDKEDKEDTSGSIGIDDVTLADAAEKSNYNSNSAQEGASLPPGMTLEQLKSMPRLEVGLGLGLGYGYYSILAVSCFTWSGALNSSDLLLSYSITSP
tara:strand:- start:570 stop:914 length:345 start_codon:yes stop_codon:yes gene_type:complete